MMPAAELEALVKAAKLRMVHLEQIANSPAVPFSDQMRAQRELGDLRAAVVRLEPNKASVTSLRSVRA